MLRFIAFVWNQQSSERCSLVDSLAQRLKLTFPEWECALSTGGLHVFYSVGKGSSSRAYVLNSNAGVVLGRLFSREMSESRNPRDLALGRQDTERIQQTKGTHIVSQYWGRYVALLREADTMRVRILRDPTGGLPCFLARTGDISVVCSHIDDCASLGLINPTINWDHVTSYLWFPRLITKDTGLIGVRQIRAGECVAIGKDSTSTEATFYWSPDRIHRSRTVDNRQQAMDELGDTVRYCVRAWSSCYNSVLHSLSGGLDSAIVLACLTEAESETKIVCQNYFTRSAKGDERGFAKSAATLAGVRLVETLVEPLARTVENMLTSSKFATPTLTRMEPAVDTMRRGYVREHGIEAVFSGQGGDHLFQQSHTRLIAADYARKHGLRPELLRIVSDTARLTGRPVLSVLATVLTHGWLRRDSDPYSQRLVQPPFISDASVGKVDVHSIRHPWVSAAKGLPSGKIRQIVSLLDSQNFYLVPSDYADIVHPLISQPIIELCLQIPSYVLTYGGIDRALIRDAFAGAVPKEILQRTVKGGTASYYLKLLISNLTFLQEYLLDGLLVQQGLLDRGQLEAALTETSLLRDSSLLIPLLNAIKAEAWLRAWLGEERRAAA